VSGGRGVAWLLVGAMAGALVAARLETALLCLAAAALGARLAGAGWPGRRWLGFVAFGAATAWLLNVFLVPGRPLGVALGPLVATREGVVQGGLVVTRLAGAMVALFGLRAAWPGERAADELARLVRPLERLRVPVRGTRAMLALAMRFAPLLAEEARRIARLQDLRAGRAPRSAAEWLQRRRAATVPLLVSALERAEQVALALEARHFRLRPWAATAPEAAAWGWGAGGAALAITAIAWR
jgi:energy-coupling factor transporter transmembrane protein EcfT